MEKEFNTTGKCIPSRHYMADVSKKLAHTLDMVKDGRYFIISQPCQSGKTTFLSVLTDALRESGDYLVVTISFENVDKKMFNDNEAFIDGLIKLMTKEIPQIKDINFKTDGWSPIASLINKVVDTTDKKVVLMVDNIDDCPNTRLLKNFLSVLRSQFLQRDVRKTFHSTILTGEDNVGFFNLRQYSYEDFQYGTPYNIASDFDVEMLFDTKEIKPMLDDYCTDRNVAMDIEQIAERLFYYTSGNPYLLSLLCKRLDEDILPVKKLKEWTIEDVDTAANNLIEKGDPHFDKLFEKISRNEALYDHVCRVVLKGETRTFNFYQDTPDLGRYYGIFSDRKWLVIQNRIYQDVIANYLATQ